jgi:hypothetical protein
MRNVSDKRFAVNHNTHIKFKKFPSTENRSVYDNVENMVGPDGQK